MDKWIIIAIVVAIALYVIGNFSAMHKNAKMPLRKKGLNDLTETLPRTNKGEEEKTTFGKK